MDWDWKALVRTVAPGIASAFGTPLAGMGVSALLDAILPAGESKPTDPTAQEALLIKTLQGANPEIMLKIKQADQAFALSMKTLEINLEQLEASKLEGARELKKEFLKSDKWDYEPFLALLVVGSFLGAEGWVFYMATHHAVVAMSNDIAILVGRVLGTVDAAFLALLSFRWGSSKGSERKTEIMGQNGNGKH